MALALGIPLFLMLLVACGAGPTNPGSTNTGSTVIKLATDFPTSGADQGIGKSTENGAHLAVDQANANHTIPGYTLQFDPQDDVGPSGTHDPTKGANNVTALAGDALVAGIVGPLNSSVALSEMPIANNAGLAMISPANTNPCLTKRGADVGCTGANDYVPKVRPTGNVTYFRLAATDDHQGPAMADYLYNTLHLKTAYVIDDTEAYGAGLSKYFVLEWTKLGGTVIDGKSHGVKSTTSYVNLLTAAAAQHPDVIYFGGNYSTGGTLIQKQMMGIPGLQKAVLAGGDGMTGSDDFYKQIVNSNGTAYFTVASPDPAKIPTAQQFIKDYQAKYGPVGPYSAAAYDSMNILIQAVKIALTKTHTPKDSSDTAGAHTFRQAVIDALKTISYNGITGHISFDQNGDTTNKIFTIYQVAMVNGKPDLLSKDVVTVQ